MIDIYDFLNKQDTLRALSDETFLDVLPELARQLALVDYHYSYSEEELKKDWKKLLSYKNSSFFTASQVRTGMKLCEHFFPNFFDIVNPQGIGFKNFWNERDLQKVLIWNRKSHSTPYISELRRGISFCFGLTKNTMFRPHLAKMICDYYKPTIVLDPCAGWGGRMLGVVASGAKYIAYEPNTETYKHLEEVASFLGIQDKVELYNEDSGKAIFPAHDLVLTSPPYYNLEVYSQEETQSENQFDTYEEWLEKWLFPLVQKSAKDTKTLCWNVANVGKMKIQDDLFSFLEEQGWKIDVNFGIGSSARQTNQNAKKNKKNIDITACFTLDKK